MNLEGRRRCLDLGEARSFGFAVQQVAKTVKQESREAAAEAETVAAPRSWSDPNTI
ncbi:MAG: hypothetical protein KGR26_16715 [Cyanobacteria bacterium REEB65]|nr:hypothetical protein [Cyanobacteria bacterium REEB65]